MTKNYDEDYFMIRMDVNDEKLPFLAPDDNSASRRFLREGPAAGSPAMVFHNSEKEENIRSGFVADTPPILFAGFDLVVKQEIRDRLLLVSVRDLFMHPAVYIDDKDHWHEDYWYLTFSQEIDCWDREKSDYDKGSPIEVGGQFVFEVDSFCLDRKVLDNILVHDRLLFKMGGVINPHIFVHKTVRSIFSAGGKSGAYITPVSGD